MKPFMSPLVPITMAVFVWCQTAVAETTPRGVAPLPISAHTLSDKFGLPTSDPSIVILHLVRLAYGTREPRGSAAKKVRDALQALPEVAAGPTESVPLPLEKRVWQEKILRRRVDEARLISAILRDRRAALLYFGMSALDDETLAWMGRADTVIEHVRSHPEVFAAFGRSVHVRGGRVIVPGGAEAEPLWTSAAGADPGNPDAFVRRLMSGDGRLAFLFDTITHLDPPRQRFALGLQLSPAVRTEGLRSLLESFAAAAPDWRVDERPFSRPPIDGAMLLSTIAVDETGAATPPVSRRLWERVFRGDELNDVRFNAVSDADVGSLTLSLQVDAAWLADRVLRVPYAIGRRRLDAFLFAQRVFAEQPPAVSADVATALRGYLSFPALSIALERIGIVDASVYARAAERAAQLSEIQPLSLRRSAVVEFQSAIVVIQRSRRTGVLERSRAQGLVRSLCDLDVSQAASYGRRVSSWLREQLVRALPTRSSSEESVLAALAGLPGDSPAAAVVEWEGHRYLADPAAAELNRLRVIRERQGTATLDVAMIDAKQLADVLASIIYAVYLGDPAGPAVTSGNVALRHDFGLAAASAAGSLDAWRLPIERFDGKAAWHVRGALLGLEHALARLSMRRLDPTSMPGEPSLGPQDRQTVMLTTALLNPFAMTDAVRDAIAGSMSRGRARIAALVQQPSRAGEISRDAGLSEWRTHALEWTLSQHPADVTGQFSLVELFWLGSSREPTIPALNEWGAASLPLTGCLCVAMPERRAWEEFGGRTAAILGTRAADVPLRVAETLSALKLPAVLAAAIAGYATEDVLERAQLAYPDEWDEFSRAARDLPRDRLFDYIAALTVNGPLVEMEK